MEIITFPRLPFPGALPEPTPCRVGDWREPLAFVAGCGADTLVAAARRLGVDFQIAATVVIEAALLLATARELRLPADPSLLDRASEQAVPAATQALRGYRRALLGLDPCRSDGAVSGAVLLPARLHQRVSDLDIDATLGRGALDQAIRWELAALSAGRFIEDWGLAAIASTVARS